VLNPVRLAESFILLATSLHVNNMRAQVPIHSCLLDFQSVIAEYGLCYAQCGIPSLKFRVACCTMSTGSQADRLSVVVRFEWPHRPDGGTQHLRSSSKIRAIPALSAGTCWNMLREQINDIMTRWNPKERPGSKYDHMAFVETPEQARKLIRHLEWEICRAEQERNSELVAEIQQVLSTVECLARRFFRWEQNNLRALRAQELREIKRLPVSL